MKVIRIIGKGINVVVGGVAKSGVKVLSKTVSLKYNDFGKYIGEVGYSVIDASQSATTTVFHLSDGILQSTYGILKKDHYHKNQGWSEIKTSTGNAAKGLQSGIKYTYNSLRITVNGLKNNDRAQTIDGLKNFGKIAAVTTFAVGILDVVDGDNFVQANEIETRNDYLSGIEHSETGIYFVEKTIELPDGMQVVGVFPEFESQFTVVIVEELYLASDDTHFSLANGTLYESIQQNPLLSDELGLSPYDINLLSINETPEEYVWHHNEQAGVLQLVDKEVHQNTGHTGGREIWGGGSEFR